MQQASVIIAYRLVPFPAAILNDLEYVQCSTAAVSKTLLASAAVDVDRKAAAPAEDALCSNRSISPACRAHSSKPAARCTRLGHTDRQTKTDRQTDGRTHKSSADIEDSKVTATVAWPVFTARCYASAVLAMALCLSVCLSQVGVLSKRLN